MMNVNSVLADMFLFLSVSTRVSSVDMMHIHDQWTSLCVYSVSPPSPEPSLTLHMFIVIRFLYCMLHYVLFTPFLMPLIVNGPHMLL